MTDDPLPNRHSPLLIYLIRHGETAWSLSGQHTSRTDLTLTSHGEDEARWLGAHLSDLAPSHIFSSPRLRAKRTAELVDLGAAITIEPDLAEWDYGDFEGKRSADIREIRPGWTIFRDGCPGGETPEQITNRADRLIDRLGSLTGTVALVSHGHFGRCLAARWIGLDLIEAQHFILGTASFGILGFDPGHPDTKVISSWNIAPPHP